MSNIEDIKFIEEMIKEYKTFGDLHNPDFEDTDRIYKALENMLKRIKELEFQNTALKAEHNHNITRIKELEQKESILDKVTDKLKEDISEAKEKIKYWEEQYRISKAKKDEFYKNSYKRQINRWQSRFETLRGILEFVEGEK